MRMSEKCRNRNTINLTIPWPFGITTEVKKPRESKLALGVNKYFFRVTARSLWSERSLSRVPSDKSTQKQRSGTKGPTSASSPSSGSSLELPPYSSSSASFSDLSSVPDASQGDPRRLGGGHRRLLVQVHVDLCGGALPEYKINMAARKEKKERRRRPCIFPITNIKMKWRSIRIWFREMVRI